MIRAALCLLVLAAGCGSSAVDPNVDRLSDLEAALRGIDRAVGVTTAFVFTGIVDTTQPAETIASAIGQRFMSETGGCATVTIAGTMVDVDLGGGCTLASTNQVYKGTVHAEAQKPTGEVVIPLTLTLTVDAQPLTGSLEISTTDGNVFSYKSDLTVNTVVHVVTPVLQAGIGAFGSSIDVMGTIVGKSVPTAPGLTLMTTGVHQRFAGCYPDDGIAVISAAMVNETITFASDTPQTGNVMVASGITPIVSTLPTRPGCPQM